jgi:predicted phosphodiesterase
MGGWLRQSAWDIPYGGVRLAVLADCHVRDGGPQLPPELFPRLQGADLIVTLGGMGQRSALDQLEALGPVLGVRGADDELDLRTHRQTLVLDGDGYRLGCVADPVAAGVAVGRHPFRVAPGVNEACERLFGGPVDILLHAGTHQPEEAPFGRAGRALNPGSPVLPAKGCRPSCMRLKVCAEGVWGQVIWIA